MNLARVQMTKHLLNYARLINSIQRIQTYLPSYSFYSTFTLDAFATDFVEKQGGKTRNNQFDTAVYQCSSNSSNVSGMSDSELESLISEILSKNKDKDTQDFISECQSQRKFLPYVSLRKLFRHYSFHGKPDMVVLLQRYCAKVDPNFYRRNGEFLHYIAKAQCMKGNSEKGLSLLKDCYSKYEGLRSFYRIIFRELIQDSVLNRSEASLMVFRKYVLEFSKTWSDHYPLVCFWHICWASTWFSDQTLASDLLEESEALQDIVKDEATALSIMALKDFNTDAVVRLLQTLLKYDMMPEYVGVLEVLFNYKLRNRDIRGCTEIIRNCEVLGVKLPSDQQGRYIKMLINNKTVDPDSKKLPHKDFKLKF